ncbi:hypothetical protein AAC387_Pa01g1282 [Persea americana]
MLSVNPPSSLVPVQNVSSRKPALHLVLQVVISNIHSSARSSSQIALITSPSSPLSISIDLLLHHHSQRVHLIPLISAQILPQGSARLQQSTIHHPLSLSQPDSPKAGKESEAEEALRAAFNAWDSNGDGFITESEGTSRCNFFKWCDTVTCNGVPNVVESSYPTCSCGAGKCNLLTEKDGKDAGRKYFACRVKKVSYCEGTTSKFFHADSG